MRVQKQCHKHEKLKYDIEHENRFDSHTNLQADIRRDEIPQIDKGQCYFKRFNFPLCQNACSKWTYETFNKRIQKNKHDEVCRVSRDINEP